MFIFNFIFSNNDLFQYINFAPLDYKSHNLIKLVKDLK